MSCPSLVALARECGADGQMGGIEKLYIVAFKDLVPLVASPTNEVYTVSSGNLVDEIGIAVGKAFVEVGLIKSTSGLNVELTKNLSTDTRYFTETFTLVLGGVTPENEVFIKSVLAQPVSIVVKTRNGKYVSIGLNGQLELATLSGGTGIAEGDMVGYNMTFTGVSNTLPLIVSPTIISEITTVTP